MVLWGGKEEHPDLGERMWAVPWRPSTAPLNASFMFQTSQSITPPKSSSVLMFHESTVDS